ncbi:Aste57867_7014 [Aphanomyces stellatus]|nr:hypothetical protein As57867_006991 [Aphanomyces stellatus]VFT83963.1 Aste57867_7014 [Aphanomyces stellatus]
MHFDLLERESVHQTLANCLDEIETLDATLHTTLLASMVGDIDNSNQVEAENNDPRPEDENNVPETDDADQSKRPAPRLDIDVATDKVASISPASPISSPAVKTLPMPSTSPGPTAARRRSSVRRKSLTPGSCKSSPGKVSLSPGKHGFANQLVLVKTKPSHKSSQSSSSQHRWAIKIARKFKPLNLSLFSFVHPAAAAVPPPVLELGPQQNAMMLRQLRYVKGVMHDLPWAKSRLRDMLSQYTQKDLTKEDLFPQLSHLSTQVQDELHAKSKAQKTLLETKSKLTVTLQLAKNVINDLTLLKFGRRGKPHETKLFYDECHPTMLYWQSKQGERSTAFLPLHAVTAIEVGVTTAVLKKASKKQSIDADCCLSLVTDERTLDLKMKNALQRDWLLKSLREVVDYAIQYRANYAAKKMLNLTPRLRRM